MTDIHSRAWDGVQDTTRTLTSVEAHIRHHDCEYQYRGEIDQLKKELAEAKEKLSLSEIGLGVTEGQLQECRKQLAAAEKLSEERRGMLEKHQWVGVENSDADRCPECGRCSWFDGAHDLGCKLARLARATEVRDE